MIETDRSIGVADTVPGLLCIVLSAGRGTVSMNVDIEIGVSGFGTGRRSVYRRRIEIGISWTIFKARC